VGSDNKLGGRLVGERFRSLGRKRVAFLGPRGNHLEMQMRRTGFAEGWDGKIEEIDVPDLSFAASRDAVLKRLESRPAGPGALFAGSDTMAVGAFAGLREHGIDVPSRCTVCGYDDSPSAIHHVPPLTTVRQDTRMAGAILVERLMQKIQGTPAPSV